MGVSRGFNLGTQLGRFTNWAGKEEHAQKAHILKYMDITKTGNVQVTNHKTVRHISQTQRCY